jgi:hypothetical protein
MNEFLRAILMNQINLALADAATASKIAHAYLTGKLREIFLDKLMKPLLSQRYCTGSGKIIDYKGQLSKEVDICIYSKKLHPPFFFSENGAVGIFPLESVLACIEVKSSFNKTTLQDAFEKFKFLKENLLATSGAHDQNNTPLSHVFMRPKCDFFAFASNIKKYTCEYVLSIYRDIDPNWDLDPLITSICVANKGYLVFTNIGWQHMSYDKNKKVNEEIIAFLASTLHDLQNVEDSRGTPRIGYYLSNGYNMDLIKNGKKVRNTWRNKSVMFTNTPIKDFVLTF